MLFARINEKAKVWTISGPKLRDVIHGARVEIVLAGSFMKS